MLKFDQEPITSGGTFLKIEAGQEVVGVLRGEVKCEYVLWENKKKTVVEPNTPGARFSFKVNFVVINKDGTVGEAKLWEQGAKIYKSLKELSADYSLEETVIKVKRTGSGMNDTVYSIIPLPKKPSDKTIAALAAAKLQPLEGEDGLPKFDSSEDVPF
jgi:hypothetical protein